jgi:hypothetical protein
MATFLPSRYRWLSGVAVGSKNRTIMSILRPKIEFRLIMTTKGFAFVIIVIAMLAILQSCGGDREAQPVLSQAEMVKALTEIYISEQKINKLGLRRDSAEREFERFKKVMFQRIDISDSAFKTSFDYYMDHPKQMEQIYTALVDSLSLMEQRLDTPKQ